MQLGKFKNEQLSQNGDQFGAFFSIQNPSQVMIFCNVLDIAQWNFSVKLS